MEKIKKVTTDELALMIGRGFGGVDKKFEKIEEDIKEIKESVAGLKTDVSELKTDVGILKTTMVTKSFMTEKLIDLKNETIEKMKKEDEKIEKVTEILGKKKVFDSRDVEEIKSIEVFPVLN